MDSSFDIIMIDEMVEPPTISGSAQRLSEALGRLGEAFRETGRAAFDFAKSIVSLTSDFVTRLSSCVRIALEEESLRNQAKAIGVNPKVIKLSKSKRKKIHNKNMNRIRKEIRKWEKKQR